MGNEKQKFSTESTLNITGGTCSQKNQRTVREINLNGETADLKRGELSTRVPKICGGGEHYAVKQVSGREIKKNFEAGVKQMGTE